MTTTITNNTRPLLTGSNTRRLHPGFQHDLVEVTPELAEEWLKDHKNIRGWKDYRSRQYAKEMANSKWQLNGTTIKFDNSGKLIDGQHRLHAIIMSKKSQVMLVCQGCTDEGTVDTGSKRSVSIYLNNDGVRNATKVASTLKHVFYWKKTKGWSVSSSDALFTYDAARILIEEIPWIEDLVSSCVGVYEFHRGSEFAAVMAAFRIEGNSPDLINIFINSVGTGEGLSRRDPAYTLRKYFWESVRKKEKLSRHKFIYYTVRALNAFLHDESLGSIHYRVVDDKPPEIPLIKKINFKWSETLRK